MPQPMLLSKNPNAFANARLDRAGHLRRDAVWLEAALKAEGSKRVALSDGAALVTADTGEPYFVGPDAIASGEPGWIFLGLDPAGAAHFAIDAAAMQEPPEGAAFKALRAAAMRMDEAALARLGCAKALFDWHARHAFCARCASATIAAEAGWKRVCQACGADHFPRVDPVVIMLPIIGDKCLLARQGSWPAGMVSAIAGFMEPGESIEEAVARETFEEVGLVVSAVRLHSSQPWPYPSSLMLGCFCTVSDEALRIDPSEIEAAFWFTRAEAQELLHAGHNGFFCPPPLAIAHQLLKTWAGESA